MEKETEKQLDQAMRKFKSAARLIRAKANNKYTVARLEQVTYADGDRKVECMVYREDHGWGYSSTWEEAFRDLAQRAKEKGLE